VPPTGGLIIPPKSTHAPSRKTTTGFTVSNGYRDKLYAVHMLYICCTYTAYMHIRQ
jgi:hypothetical protein